MAATACAAVAALVLGASPVTETLDNDLQVVVDRIPGLPEVGVAVAYRLGQRDDPPGYDGLAHLAEHLTFRGSRHLPGLTGYQTIAEIGGRTNGKTFFDATVYVHAVPRAGLERALWVESDRMAFVLDMLTANNLALEQRIVGSELSLRRGPAGGPGLLVEYAFPKSHPYYVSPDEAADVEAVTLQGLKGFLQRGYRTDLAAIAVVGDVRPDEVLALVRKYYGPIPRPATTPPPRVNTSPDVPCYQVDGSRRGRGLIQLFWKVPVPGPPGELELLISAMGDLLADELPSSVARVRTSVTRTELETLISLAVEPRSRSLKRVQGPLRRALGELSQRLDPARVEAAREIALFDHVRAHQRPEDLAEAWAQSLVTTLPSPRAIEGGLRTVAPAAIIARARRLSGARPDIWIEVSGLQPREFPKELRLRKMPCRKL